MINFFILTAPLWWILIEFKISPVLPLKKIGIRFIVLFLACQILSLTMHERTAALMGGKWTADHVLIYGQFLFSLFSILQITKKLINNLLVIIISEKASQEKLKNIFRQLINFCILAILMIPFFLSITLIHRIKIGDSNNPETLLSLAYDNVSFKTKDNFTIHGWFVPTDSNKAVIIAHGLGANKSNFITTVFMWHDLGYNVLIFDFRGHGASDGWTVSFGYPERQDVLAASEFLQTKKKFTPQQTIGFGVSFGGAAMLHAAAEKKIFNKIIIDSSYADLNTMAEKIVEGERIIPPFMRQMVVFLGVKITSALLGFDIRSTSPQNIIKNIAPTPILFLHGKGDPLIPYQQSELLFQQAAPPKQLILFETTDHFGTIEDPDYLSSLHNFLIQN